MVLKKCGGGLAEGRPSLRATMGNGGEGERVAGAAQAYRPRRPQRWREDQVEAAAVYIRVSLPVMGWKESTCYKQLREFHDSRGF